MGDSGQKKSINGTAPNINNHSKKLNTSILCAHYRPEKNTTKRKNAWKYIRLPLDVIDSGWEFDIQVRVCTYFYHDPLHKHIEKNIPVFLNSWFRAS